MLGRLGLQLAGRGDLGHQRQVDEQRLARARARSRTGGSPRGTAGPRCRRRCRRSRTGRSRASVDVGADELLDRVGDVRDDLDRAAQIVAVALALEHGRIDPPGGDVVAAARRHAGEPLVMAEVEVGLRPVVGDVHLAVLIGLMVPGSTLR